jgi:hypothetical protein
VLKIQKFKEWVHDRNDVLYCEENVEVFKLIFEKGCDGIEGKIKESINNENKSLGTDLLMDDFFRGNDVDDEELINELTKRGLYSTTNSNGVKAIICEALGFSNSYAYSKEDILAEIEKRL